MYLYVINKKRFIQFTQNVRMLSISIENNVFCKFQTEKQFFFNLIFKQHFDFRHNIHQIQYILNNYIEKD